MLAGLINERFCLKRHSRGVVPLSGCYSSTANHLRRQGSGNSWRQFARASPSEGDDSGGAEEEPMDGGGVAGGSRSTRAHTGVRHDTKTKRNAKQQAQNKQVRSYYSFAAPLFAG